MKKEFYITSSKYVYGETIDRWAILNWNLLYGPIPETRMGKFTGIMSNIFVLDIELFRYKITVRLEWGNKDIGIPAVKEMWRLGLEKRRAEELKRGL